MCPLTGWPRGQVLGLQVTLTELKGKREPVGVFKVEKNGKMDWVRGSVFNSVIWGKVNVLLEG